MPTPLIYDFDTEHLDFFEALKLIAEGRSIAREDWEDEPECRCGLIREQLCIYRDSEWHPWTITLGDMEGDDWVTWEEE